MGLWIVVGLTMAIGYVINVIELVAMGFDPFTAEVAARTIGLVLFPLGAIMELFV